MNTFEASLEIMKLSIGGKAFVSNIPAEKVRENLRHLAKINEKVLKIEELIAQKGCKDCRPGEKDWPECNHKCADRVIELLKLMVANEAHDALPLSERIDKVLDYYEELGKQGLEII